MVVRLPTLVEPLQDLPTWSATRRVISGDAAQPIEQAELGVDAEVDESPSDIGSATMSGHRRC